MKARNPKTLAALVGASLAAALFLHARPAARADHRPTTWEPAETCAWADPGEAERFKDLEARSRRALGRCAEKAELVDALLRGDRTLAEAAAGFREANSGHPCPYGDVANRYPHAGENELAHRQVVERVRRRARSEPARYAAALAAIEAEVTRRFPEGTRG